MIEQAVVDSFFVVYIVEAFSSGSLYLYFYLY